MAFARPGPVLDENARAGNVAAGKAGAQAPQPANQRRFGTTHCSGLNGLPNEHLLRACCKREAVWH